METALKRSFKDICNNFFPRWKNARHWEIKRPTRKEDEEMRMEDPVWQARCLRDRKLILIKNILYLFNKKNPYSKKSLYSLIIHEICHAVTNDYHGKRFEQRMLRTSRRAYKMGDRMLGNMIIHSTKQMKGV